MRDATGAGQSVSGSYVTGDVVLVREVGGDVTINSRHPPYRMEAFPITVLPLSVASAQAQPSRLLQSRYAVVPFAGRDNDLTHLRAWLDSEAAVSVQLIHAAGGQGKTRLAGHLAFGCAAASWTVWRVHHNPTRSASSQVDLPVAGQVLAVVDYADRWPVSHLLSLLTDLRNLGVHTGNTVRVLMLARSTGFWWPTLVDRADSELTVDATEKPLLPLGKEIDPLRLFDTARQHFAKRLRVVGTEALTVPHGLIADNLVLSAHMAALVEVDALRHGIPAPVSAHEISAYLLRREYAHWKSMHGRSEDPIATTEATMRRTVYLATLTGTLSRESASEVLNKAALVDNNSDANQVIDDHHMCYPPTEPINVFEPLHPDRLGEDFLALSTPENPHDYAAWLRDDWTMSAATRLIASDASGDLPEWAPPVVTTLVETARRWPHVAIGVLYPLIRTNPIVAIAAGGTTLTRLATLDDVDPALLATIEALLPDEPHLDLDIAGAAISATLTAHRLAATSDPAEKARLHAKHAVRLANAGQRHDAVTSAEEAAELYRRLAQANPAIYLADFVASLNNVGAFLSGLGRREEALALAQEATAICHRLIDVNPADYAPNLALSLNNLSTFLSNLGRHDEALVPAEKASALYRWLADANSAAYLPNLAASLENVGGRLSSLGRHDEALASAEEASALYRRLTDANPAAYLPGLALSLSNMGELLSRLGRREEALAPVEEAVAIRRRLAEINPSAYLPNLAMSLRNLGVRCWELGRREEALAPGEEASALYRRLADANPVAYLPDLAVSLNDLGNFVSELGRREEALALAEEASALYRRLADANPVAYLPNFALSLSNLGVRLWEVSRREEALAPAEEAVAIRRRLADANPAAHLPDFAESLNNVGVFLAGLGRRDEALAPTEEVVAIRRRLAEVNPAAHLPGLAGSLVNLGQFLSGLGRHDEALALAEEAVALYRPLAEVNPAAHLPNLAISLQGYGNVCAEGNMRLSDALTAVQEGITVLVPLARQAPQRFGPDLASACTILADLLDRLGRSSEAEELRRKLKGSAK
jgi:hypothetical protein